MTDLIWRALDDVRSRELFVILLQSIALTLALIGALGWLGVYGIEAIPTFDWNWLNRLIDILAGIGLTIGLIILFFPVAAIFIGLFLEPIADAVEARNYPEDPPARGLAFLPGLGAALRFLAVLIFINIVLIPFYFLLPGIGFLLGFALNAYLIGREYFELVALRHRSPGDVAVLRRHHRMEIFKVGAIIALALSIPLVNLIAPLFGAALMVHVFKGMGRQC